MVKHMNAYIRLSLKPTYSSTLNWNAVANSINMDSYGMQELAVHQRGDAVSSLVYEANARMRDPVYGCVGAISYLQNQVSQLQMQLAVAQTEILCIQMNQDPSNVETQAQNNYEPDDKSFIFQNNISQHQYLNFPSSSDHHHVIQDSLKRESYFGHDMVS